MKRQAVWILLGLILLVGLFVRAVRVPSGLPYSNNPDEYPTVVAYLNILKTGDLNPHFFVYPGATLYFNLAVYTPYYLFGRITGEFSSRADIHLPIYQVMGTSYIATPSVFYIGRSVSVFLGVSAILIIFFCGKRASGSAAAGLVGALLLAVSSINVSQSALILPNVFLVFFSLLTLWYSLLIFQSGRRVHYLLAGLAAGMAIASKYNVALIILLIPSAHFLRVGWREWKSVNLWLALLTSGITFAVFNPFIFLDFSTFLSQLQSRIIEPYTIGIPGREGNAALWYLSYLWKYEGPAMLLAVIELGIGLYKKSSIHRLLVVYPVLYSLFILLFPLRKAISLMPILPFLYILAGLFFKRCWEWIAYQQGKQAYLRGVFLILLILGFLVPAIEAFSMTATVLVPRSSELARIWIEENIPAGAKIAIQPYSPYVDPQKYDVVADDKVMPYDIDWYRTNGVDYIIFNKGAYGRFYTEPERYAEEVAIYDRLISDLELVKEFTVNYYEIKIFKVNR